MVALAGVRRSADRRGDTDNILRYDRTTGAYKGVFASHPRLDSPYGIVADPAGRIYVGGGNTGSVVAFDGQTGVALGFINLPQPEGGAYSGVGGFRNGRLYAGAVEPANARTYLEGFQVDPFDGTSVPFLNSTDAGVVVLTAGAFGPDGHYYTGSNDTDAIYRFDGTTGAFIGVFVVPGLGGLDNPQWLTFGPDNQLYVASFVSNQILRYDGTTGAFLGAFGSGVTLDRPVSLAFGPDGNLYVADLGPGVGARVWRFDGASGAAVDLDGGGNAVPFILGDGSNPLDLSDVKGFLWITPVPEPGAALLPGAGAAVLLMLALRRRRPV